MKIALSTDHAGYAQARELRDYIEELGYEVEYFGPGSMQQSDDYPRFVAPAAKAVASGKCAKGIILGGSGQGEAMSANRFRGVRCAVFYGPIVARRVVDIDGRTSHDAFEIIKLSRLHNDSNMLSLAARFVSLAEMKHAVKLWLETEFSGEPRHERRITELDEEN